jgi:hypothetical protein
VHASLVLFNVCFAFRTRLCVDFEPGVSISLLIASDSIKPSLKQLALNRCMRGLQTTEAKVFATFAKAVVRFCNFDFDDLLALFARTPLCTLAQIHKRLVAVAIVLFPQLWFNQVLENDLRYNVLAFLIWTLGECTLGTLLYLHF